MNYTPEQLREWADERAEGAAAHQLRAHDDALERLEKAEADLAAIEADAERYRHHAEVWEGRRGIWVMGYDADFMSDQETDAEIRAAMKDKP